MKTWKIGLVYWKDCFNQTPFNTLNIKATTKQDAIYRYLMHYMPNHIQTLSVEELK